MVSTPKITGMSRIEAAYAESDPRRFYVPCPICREFQVLKFAQLRWPKGEPERAMYVCEHCGQEIANHQKQWMLPRGQRRAEAAGDGKTAGFHLSSLYSPVGWFPWSDAAAMFEQAQKLRAAMWRRWKTPRRRRAALLELGVRPRLASNTAGSGLGPWYLAKAKALSVGLSNAHFKSLGLPSLFEAMLT